MVSMLAVGPMEVEMRVVVLVEAVVVVDMGGRSGVGVQGAGEEETGSGLPFALVHAPVGMVGGSSL